MKNLYRLNEFTGELPNPKSFPTSATIIAVEDKSYIFANGFIVDLFVREADGKRLREKSVSIVDVSIFNGYLREAKEARLLLSEPEFIYDATFPAYVVFTSDGNPVVIQVKYYKYFRNRYPECKFCVKEEEIVPGMVKPLAIKVDEEVVGLCMPMFFNKETLGKIKEERK